MARPEHPDARARHGDRSDDSNGDRPGHRGRLGRWGTRSALLGVALALTFGSTLPAGASSHLSPPADAGASLGWVRQAPLSDLDQAAAADELTLVATAGSSAPVVTNVGFGSHQTMDVDRNGDDDLEAWLAVSTDADPPRANLNVTKVEEGTHPTDVEILAFVPWGDFTDEAAQARHNLVVGFRTAQRDSSGALTTGGQLPAHQIIGFQMGPVNGLQHQLQLQYVTEGGQNPLRLLTGHFDGSDDDGVLAANLVSALPHEPTSNVTVTLDVDASELGTSPEHGEASLSWAANDPVPVTFDYLEAERTPDDPPQVDTHVLADEMPADTTLALTLQEDGGDTNRPAVLTWSADAPTDLLEAHHRRNNDDGPTIVNGRLRDVEPETELAVHDEGSVNLTLPDGGRVDVELEAILADLEGRPDGRAWFGVNELSHELDHLVARIDDAPELTVTPDLGKDAGIALELPTGGPAPPDVRFLATSWLGDPVLPDSWSDGSPTVSGHPETWPTPAQRSGGIGVVDDHTEGSSVAARFGGLEGLQVATTADTMAETVTAVAAVATDLRLDTVLTANAPMADGTAVEVACDLQLPAGEIAIDVEQPDHVGWMLSDEMPHLRCEGERGDTSFLVEADRIPARTTVDVPDFGDASGGSLEVVAHDAGASPVDTAIGRLELRLRDDGGLTTDDELLGHPVQFAVVRAQDLPSSDASWSTAGGQTSVDIAARTDDAPENRIGALDVRLRTDPPGQEVLSGIPTPTLGGTRHFDAHYLQAVEEGASVWLGAGVRDAEQLQARTTDSGTSTSMAGSFAQRHPAVVDLRTSDGGPFTSGWALRLQCSVGPVSFQLDELTITPPEQRLTLDAPDGFGNLACHSPQDRSLLGHVERAADDLDASLIAAGGGLPPSLTVDLDPDRKVTLDTGPGEVGSLHLRLQDRSGNGLPAAGGLFSEPLGAASVRLDDAASSTVAWTSDPGGRLAAIPDHAGGKVGTVQVDLTTGDHATRLDAVAGGDPHRFELTESRDGSYHAALAATLVQVGGSTVDLSDGLRAELSTVADRMLEVEIHTDAGGEILPAQDVDAVAELENVPGSLTYQSDLAGHHEIDGTGDVDALRFDGTVGDVHANGVVTGLPSALTIDTRGPSVTADGGVTSLDAEITDDSDADGLFEGVNELRVTAESLPGDLAVDVEGLRADTAIETHPDGDVRVLDGTASLGAGEGSSGPIGRLAVTVASTAGDGFFDTPYRYAHVDLEGVPTSWTVGYRHDAETGDTEVDVAPGQGSLSSALVQATRTKGGAASVSEELVAFEQDAAGLERSAFTATIDERHFRDGVRRRLDDLFADPASLATTTEPERADPWPEQGQGPGDDLTVPDQDHAVLLEGDQSGPKTLSARISDVSSVSLALHGPTSDTRVRASLERSDGEPDPFFLGVRDRTRTRHAEPDGPLSAPDREEGHPQASDTTVVYTVSTSGAVPFRPLANDEPASDADEDQLDTSTLRIVEGPAHGTAIVDGERIAYEPDAGHVGRDQLRYEICDQGGDCSQAVFTAITAERYHDATVVSLADLPDELTVDVVGTDTDEDDDTTWEPREIEYRADTRLGRLDVYQGPLDELRILDEPGVAAPQRIRAVAYDGPSELAAQLNGTGLLGIDTFDVDTSGVTDVVAAIQQADRRSVVGFRGEDLSVDTPIEGALNGDTFAFEAKSGHPHRMPNVDGTDGCKLSHPLTPCAQLAFAGLDLRARGDDTGAGSSGFVSLYRRRGDLQELLPPGPTPGEREWVPGITGRYRDVRGISAGIELRLLPFNPLLLNFKAGANINATSAPAVDVDLWWNADEACVPVHPTARDQISSALGTDNTFRPPAGVGPPVPDYALTYDPEAAQLCLSFRVPDYADGDPIEIAPTGLVGSFGFDPYQGELPKPVDRLGSGTLGVDELFVAPGLRFLVVPLDGALASAADAGGLTAQAGAGEIEVLEQPPGEVDPPIPGDTLAAVRLDGDPTVLSSGVQVIFDLGHYAPDGQPVCAANRRAGGDLGAVSCMNLPHDEAVERETGGLLRLVVEQPGTVVLAGSSLPSSACDEPFVPPAGFGDTAGSVHEHAVDCMAWYGLTKGLGDTDDDGAPAYGPRDTLRRDQMASFVTRLAVQAGASLPDDPPDAFDDDDGSVHEGNIDALAALGVVEGRGDVDGDGRPDYLPGDTVTRDQMASFLVRLHERLADTAPDDPPEAFGDDDGSVHEDNIDALAALGVTRGRGDLDGDGRVDYAPREPVFRDQMASFLARELDVLAEDGVVHPGDTLRLRADRGPTS